MVAPKIWRERARFGAPEDVVVAVQSMSDDDVVFMGQAPLRVDFLRSIDGVDSTDLFDEAISANIDGARVKIISLDHLIVNKRAAGRAQDLLDVEYLERVRDRRAGT